MGTGRDGLEKGKIKKGKRRDDENKNNDEDWRERKREKVKSCWIAPLELRIRAPNLTPTRFPSYYNL